MRLVTVTRIPKASLTRTFATASTLPVKDCTTVTPPYPRLLETLDRVRNVLPKGTKLTLAEKILYAHLRNPEESLGGGGKVRGERYLKLRPDRVAMQVGRPLVASVAELAADQAHRTLQLKWLCSNS
jgi:hypothetical protein